MQRFPSPDDADRLLAGSVHADDLPSEAAALAALLAGMRRVAGPEDEAAAQLAISTIAAEIRGGAIAITRRTPRMLTRRISAKAGVAAFALVLAGGTAAAAANGSLPGPAQRAISNALSHVNVSVPSPNGHANAHARGHAHGADGAPGHDQSGATGARGPDATGSPRFGLCTAADAGASTHSVAASNLEAAATAAGMSVAEYCAGVTHPGHPGGTTTSIGGTPTTRPGEHGSTPTSHPEGPPTSTPGSVSHPTDPTHSTTPTTGAVGGASGPTGSSGSANARAKAGART